MLVEYGKYVAAAETGMKARFDSGELAWLPVGSLAAAAARLRSGHAVRFNVSHAAVNGRIALSNATIIHWVGAIRIRSISLAQVASVLGDYGAYDRIYRPMVYQSHSDGEQLLLGLRSSFRFASLIPQHYAFQARGRILRSGGDTPGSPLRIHLWADEIRESDSGVPWRNDLLEPYRDHGIMWALNAYWRARQQKSDVYLEFETITLARSVEAFACKIGFLPVPRSTVAAAMNAIPSESVLTVLEGTKRACERRGSAGVRGLAGKCCSMPQMGAALGSPRENNSLR